MNGLPLQSEPKPNTSRRDLEGEAVDPPHAFCDPPLERFRLDEKQSQDPHPHSVQVLVLSQLFLFSLSFFSLARA